MGLRRFRELQALRAQSYTQRQKALVSAPGGSAVGLLPGALRESSASSPGPRSTASSTSSRRSSFASSAQLPKCRHVVQAPNLTRHLPRLEQDAFPLIAGVRAGKLLRDGLRHQDRTPLREVDDGCGYFITPSTRNPAPRTQGCPIPGIWGCPDIQSGLLHARCLAVSVDTRNPKPDARTWRCCASPS